MLEIADKEFQEIRTFLQDYRIETAEKVKGKEFQDAEIDAISLEAIIATNPDIVALNGIIADYRHCPLSQEIPTTHLETSINALHLLGIYTISQLSNCIKNNKDDAEIIAKAFSSNDTTNENSQRVFSLSKTISVNYICFAELTRRDFDYNQIMQYFEELNITFLIGSENAARYLLQLSEKRNTSS